MQEFFFISLFIIIIYFFILKPYFIKPFKAGLNGSDPSNKVKNPSNIQSNEKEAKDVINPTNSSQSATPQEKGKMFEEFVVRRFKSESFYKLKEWRGDKYVDGIYPESSTYPDLELEFNIKDIKRRFAIECKYRSKAYDGFVEFAEQRQLQTYKAFERDNNIPVYILLGFGGLPSEPEELFLIPVSDLHHPYLSIKDLREYVKDKNSPFYYNLLDESLN